MRRNHLGYRVGQDHHRAKADDSLVRRARELHGNGWGYKRIGREINVPARTAADWCRYETRWLA